LEKKWRVERVLEDEEEEGGRMNGQRRDSKTAKFFRLRTNHLLMRWQLEAWPPLHFAGNWIGDCEWMGEASTDNKVSRFEDGDFERGLDKRCLALPCLAFSLLFLFRKASKSLL